MLIFSYVMIVLLVGALIAQFVVKIRQDKRISELSRVVLESEEENRNLTSRIGELAKYEPLERVEAEIDARRRAYVKAETEARDKAKREIGAVRLEAKGLLDEAKAEAAEQRAKLREKQAEAEEKQALALSSATREAERIVGSAEEKAKEIAGDALTALREARNLEQTAQAMKNIIKGYGDEYLVPNHSVLDDLADEYGHKQAGVELKTARARTKQLITSGKAAACDYAEARRKETAIHFVLDAFNGKVDSILSNVKHDNYGTLEQEIRDAFSTVNHNGEAFRNARIVETYLEARLQELRWAVAVNELKLIEREEQRQIRQDMREEEKARKEYEKAVKEAEKEERLIQKAMEKAKKELEVASVEEREKFEAQLRELEEKLHEAEEKNQRAISMAQQTKRGHVYVISNVGSFGENVFKIGLTRRLEPFDRVRELGDASVPFPFDVHAMIFSEDAPALETELHKNFSERQMNRVNPRKEFFRVSLAEIRNHVEERNLETKWTLVAEAHEYRETVAMEKSAQAKQEGIVA